MRKLTDEQLKTRGLEASTLPRHVAIIMDGNGRWANQRGLPRALGHRAGVNRLREIIRFSSDAGMEALTLYAFSTENWRRPSDEVGTLMSLLIEYFQNEIDELDANRVRIRTLGDITALPAAVYRAVSTAVTRTAGNDGLILSIALNYGSHAELLYAVNACLSEGAETVSESDFAAHLYTAGLPELDLLIRTGGEKRLSNFLLYQASYAELIFTDDYWPDYDEAHYAATLSEFAHRKRRYGGLGAGA